MLPTKTLKASQRRLHSGAIRCEMLRPLGDVLTKLKENKIMHSQRIEQNELRKLDDGWPESVEEQSLLLLVWRHYITR